MKAGRCHSTLSHSLMEHWASIVDLIGRAGCIFEAFRFMNEMSLEPNSSLIRAFLGACRIHGDGKKWGGRNLKIG